MGVLKRSIQPVGQEFKSSRGSFDVAGKKRHAEITNVFGGTRVSISALKTLFRRVTYSILLTTSGEKSSRSYTSGTFRQVSRFLRIELKEALPLLDSVSAVVRNPKSFVEQ